MKKIFVALIALALVAGSVQQASAGGHGGCGGGWGTAAAVLTGVTAGVIVGSALAPRPVYYTAPAPAYYPAPGYGYAYYGPAPQPAVVYAAPPPVVVYRPPVYVAAPVVAVGVRVGVRGYHHGHW